MKRLLALAVALVCWVSPAAATALLNIGVTTAVTTQLSSTFQLRPGPAGGLPTNMTLQGNFTFGSGGTSADAYVQTSIDGGLTWTDVANFHFTTASARFIYNLSSATSFVTEYVPTDGTLGGNTAKDGVFGNQWRVKFTTVGTYAGSTTLRVDAFANGLTAFTPGD